MGFKKEVIDFTVGMIQKVVGTSDESLVHNEFMEIAKRLDKLDKSNVNVDYLHKKFNLHKNELTNVQKVNNFLIDLINDTRYDSKITLTEYINGKINRYEEKYDEEEF